jgi:hypothetical protein
MIYRNRSSVPPSRLLGVCALWMLAIAGCDRPVITPTPTARAGAAENATPAAGTPSPPAPQAPLLLEDEAMPLPGEGENNEAAGTPGADNSRCFVCHANYMEEKLATTHARARIGCADCHGPSDAHIADESWASGGNGTAPSIMYPREKINSACMTCHTREKIDTPQHQAVLAESTQKVCTDCHGRHRLPQRRCKWK